MSNVRASIAWSFLSKYLTTILAFGSVVVLARLLTPEQIGIYSIAAAFFTIGQHFRDFGIGSYLIQEKDLTRDKLKSAFALSIAVCWSLGLLFIVSSSYISDFYDRPELDEIFIWLEFCFFIMPFGALPKAMLKREMKFKAMLIVDVSSSVVHAATGLIAAYLGYGYMSLAWASFAGISTSILVVLFFRPASMPWGLGFSEITHIAKFGWRITTSNIAGHLRGVAPELIVGRMFGAPAVAILGKATSSTNMFRQLIFQGIDNVATPVFAENNRDGGDPKGPFIFASSCLLAISWPFFGFMGLNASEIILFLFGDQWVDAVPLLEVMCLAAMIQTITSFVPTYLVSVGQVGRMAKLQILFLVTGTTLILLGAMYSLYYVCLAVVLQKVIELYCYSKDMRLALKVSSREIVAVLSKVSVITVSAMIGPVAIYAAGEFYQVSIYVVLILGGGLSLIGWLLAIHLTRHEISDELFKIYRTVGIVKST
ncbi:MAG: lipopolysaccharide biosynthesis protein [Pseudomonadales bacterium]|nr:lipopolysaccharide biosynthesis protein [Pseudomonadales bacterium]